MLMTKETTKLWRAWRGRRDSGAFERLVKDEVPYAIDLARRLGADHGEAEDVVQDSLVKLAREKSNDPLTVGLRAWICRRVVLGYRMRVRASSRRRRHERTAMSAPASSRQAPRPAAPELDQRDEVQAALRHLDEEQRRAVVLRYLHDLDYREIAYVLGITENACRLRVHKALKRLRAILGGKAPALLAAITLPAAAAQASVVKGAVTAAAVAGKKITMGWAAAATLATAAGTTAVVMLLPEKAAAPALPPAKVAKLEPKPQPKPQPPPVAPAPPQKKAPVPTGLDYLARHLGGDKTVAARRSDFDKFAACIKVPRGPVFRIDGELKRVPPGTRVVEFGPGTYDLTSWRLPATDGIEIRGAGRLKTLLTGRAAVYVAEKDKLPQLRIAGLTVEGDLLNVRGAAAVLLERVTMRNWVTTAGFGAPMGNSGRLYLAARDCVFVGGYRRPAGGYALNVRGPALALFDRCRFIDLNGAIMGSKKAGRATSILLRRSVFENSTALPGGYSDLPEVLLEQERTVSARVPRLRELLAFLDDYSAPEGARVTGLYRMQWDGQGRPVWAIHLIASGRRSVEWSPSERRGPPVLAPRLPGRDKLYTLTPLGTVLDQARGTGMDLDLEVHAIADWALHAGAGKMIPSVAFLDRLGRPVFQIRTDTLAIEGLRRGR